MAVKRPIRICLVITRSDVFGGASVHLLQLASGLQRNGHFVTILIGGSGVVAAKARQLGLKVTSLSHMTRPINPYRDLLCCLELRRIIKGFAPDLIHLHSSKAGLVGRLAAIGLGIPVVFTAHGWSFTDGVSMGRSLLYRTLERFAAPLASQIITVSEYDRRRALQVSVGTEDQLQTVHNGIPLRIRPGDDTREPGKLIMVARFEEPKDHQLLLHAMTLVRGDWKLQLIGDGPLLAAAQRTAIALNIFNRIDFAGVRDDVPLQLERSAVFILLSRWEGLPLTILEAMRAGVAVVASRVGGIPELVDENVTGFLVRNEPTAAAAAIQALLDDSSLRTRFGEAGQKRFLAHFTFEQMLSKTEAVYQRALASRHVR